MTARMRRRITTAKREEIEAEQKILDNTIVRPFTTLEDLPISYNEPPNGHYEDILKNPLTIKDSAVLYNSLIRSRSTYIYHAPMFKLHWVKQTAYAKKLAEMDKEKQKEILRDRENKRRTPVLSPEVNARDVMSKLCESSITLGPHTMDIRIFIAKDSRSEKSRAISELSKVEGTSQGKKENVVSDVDAGKCLLNDVSSKVEDASVKQPTSDSASLKTETGEISKQDNTKCSGHIDTAGNLTTAEVESQKSNDSCQSNPETGFSLSKEYANTEHELKSKTPEGSTAHTDPHETRQEVIEIPKDQNSASFSSVAPNGTKQQLTTDNEARSSSSNNVSTAPDSHNAAIHTSAPKNSTSMSSVKPSMSHASPSVPTAPSKTGPTPVARPSPTNLQSIDNTIMISNLNAIAKIDLSLNDLMKEVALGKASEVQISRFKRYIERAKQMGPQPHHAELYFNRGLSLPPDFPRPYQTRPMVEKKAPPKQKVFNPMKLTAFQEKYLNNATLVFEFLENPNVRYIIPQESICEVLKPEFPIPKDAEVGTEYNDILISHMWIHNIDEMENYEIECANYKAEVERQKQEEEHDQKGSLEDDSAKVEVSIDGEKHLRPEARSLRTKKKTVASKKKKSLSQPVPPHLKYTTFSFTIHNIPSRFVPIFKNSMKPSKEVHKRMENILKTGTRITSFYLWYQVDARLDEAFAENLRNIAVAEEKKMTGFL
ncbi:hypothetical protein METBIDRAFT_22569, partial [Metschnikowia bicuspidata var. bicuspidata NRRL YB-4993]